METIKYQGTSYVVFSVETPLNRVLSGMVYYARYIPERVSVLVSHYMYPDHYPNVLMRSTFQPTGATEYFVARQAGKPNLLLFASDYREKNGDCIEISAAHRVTDSIIRLRKLNLLV